MTDRFRDRLSEYRDGELAPAEEALVERHLEECDECSAILTDLEAVAAKAAGLSDRTPETDLWDGIAVRLEDGIEDGIAATGPARPTAESRGLRFARRVSLTIPQLAAAAVALATVSSAGAWMALGGSGATTTEATGDVVPVEGAALVSTQGETDEQTAERYTSVIAELEAALFDPAADLPPDTEASLRRALLKIDRAIEDAEKALEALPGDAYLEEHRESTMRRKADFLRRAVRLSQG